MRVLLTISSNEGTIAKVSYNLYNALKKLPNVEVYVFNFNKTLKHGFEFENYTDIPYNKKANILYRQFYNMLKLLKYILYKRKINPEITISTQELCSTLSVLSHGSDFKIGVFHAPLSQSKLEGTLNYLIQYFSYKFLYKRLSKLVCVSTEVKNSILNSFNIIEPKKIQVVYNVHNFDEINYKSKLQLPDQDSNLFKDSNVILYVGRFDKNKAPERIIEAYNSLISTGNSFDNTKLVLLGSGKPEYIEHLKILISKYSLTDRVVFLGHRSNPYNYISNSKLVVSCSYSEGLPGVLIESLFLNIPIVSTNSSSGVWEILDSFDSYHRELEGVVLAEKGLIVQNKKDDAFGNNKYLTEALKIALDENQYEKFKKSNFNFHSKLNERSIVKSLLYSK